MDNSQPLVSIIVPTYNYAHLISETLNALMTQSYQNWECIIIDDGSKDNTAEIVDFFIQRDHRFRYHFQNNKGLAGARNTGLGLARGEFIQFLDADDVVSADKIFYQVSYLFLHPETDLVYCDVYVFKHEKGIGSAKKFQLETKPVSGRDEELLKELIKDNIFLVHAPLFRFGILKGQRFNEELKALEDWHLWMRLALNSNRFDYDPNPNALAFVRSHGFNMSGNRKRMWFNKSAARKNLMEKFEDHYLMKKYRNINQQFYFLDRYRYNLRFDDIIGGVKETFNYIRFSRKVYFGLYDAAYWIKERIKNKGK